jgi:hypothetical protein
MEKRRPLRHAPNDHNFGIALNAGCYSWRVSAGDMGCHKRAFLFAAGVPNPLKATVQEFANAYAAASPDEQAERRLWMRRIILPGKIPRTDLARVKRSEKESVAARDRRILEFPLSMTPNAVAKALRAEGWYSTKTTVYHIEYRVRRLREKAERERLKSRKYRDISR